MKAAAVPVEQMRTWENYIEAWKRGYFVFQIRPGRGEALVVYQTGMFAEADFEELAAQLTSRSMWPLEDPQFDSARALGAGALAGAPLALGFANQRVGEDDANDLPLEDLLNRPALK